MKNLIATILLALLGSAYAQSAIAEFLRKAESAAPAPDFEAGSSRMTVIVICSVRDTLYNRDR
ncbi:MAG: hypothetical protein HY067_01220 [Betaproteobacteria bacterium]|nr:hypothetical protein [Betaproteobacteria bacterium]